MAGIEIAQIPASLDYATYKHNEDMHASLVQSHVGAENEKKTDLSHSQVATTEKSEMRPDDNGGSGSGYAGDGGMNRKKHHEEAESDKVVIKGSSSSFDIKI